MKLERKRKTKPLFWEWIMYDPKAFRVVFFMSAFSGLLVSTILFIIGINYRWDITVNIIIGIFLVISIINVIKLFRKRNFINTSINDFVYNGKYHRQKDNSDSREKKNLD